MATISVHEFNPLSCAVCAGVGGSLGSYFDDRPLLDRARALELTVKNPRGNYLHRQCRIDLMAMVAHKESDNEQITR